MMVKSAVGYKDILNMSPSLFRCHQIIIDIIGETDYIDYILTNMGTRALYVLQQLFIKNYKGA